MSNLLTDCECASSMTTDKVHWFLDLFDELGIKVWIDGGWGVDALLGECTRNHQDLDIIISWEDSAILTEALLARGFVDIHRLNGLETQSFRFGRKNRPLGKDQTSNKRFDI